MDFMVAYYPAFYFFAALALITSVVWLVKEQKYKLAAAMTFAILVFMYLAPVKIDGTETAKYHKSQEHQRDSQYSATIRELPPIHIVKPEFDDRMKAEEERSDAANAKIEAEISK